MAIFIRSFTIRFLKKKIQEKVKGKVKEEKKEEKVKEEKEVKEEKDNKVKDKEITENDINQTFLQDFKEHIRMVYQQELIKKKEEDVGDVLFIEL